ncbi:MAG TPA: MlaD family protein, partial [Spirochaetia bacterium]|nr:MlaD family protein [Spirochaetia bacterium]
GQRVRVALFFLVAIGSFVVFAVVVAGQNLWQRYDTYYIRFTDTSVGGIQAGGSVVYQGIAVGSIETIEIDPQNIESIVITIEVREGTPIKTDVTARIVPVGITGFSQIELSGGTQEASRLEPGSFIRADASALAQVTESARDILEGIEGLLADISGVLNEVDEASVGNILSRVDAILATNQEAVETLVGELNRTARSVGSVSEELESLLVDAGSITDDLAQLVAESAPAITSSVLALEESMAVINRITTSGDVEELVGSAGEVAAEIDLMIRRNKGGIEDAIDVLNDTLRQLNNFAFQINTDPSLLVVPEERQ